MGSDKPRYFVKVKGSYYWRPTPRMKAAGFLDRPLGKNEVHAKQEAIRLNAEWDHYRFGEPRQPHIMVYPRGSLGHAYHRALALREAERKAKGITWTSKQKARDDWPRAWRWIGPAFGDYDPVSVVSEDLLALRAKIAERVSESEAFRAIKIWRALWAKLTPLGYTVPPGSDPSTFANSAPGTQRWFFGEAPRWAPQLPTHFDGCVALLNSTNPRHRLVGEYGMLLRRMGWNYHLAPPFEVFCSQLLSPPGSPPEA